MLQNSRVTDFTVFELFRENQLGVGGKITPPPPPLPHTHALTGSKASKSHRYNMHILEMKIRFNYIISWQKRTHSISNIAIKFIFESTLLGNA